MNLKFSSLVTASALALTVPAFAQDSAAPEQAQERIHFANLGGIQDWRAVDDKTLYIQGRNRQWFRADLMATCTGLRNAETIGFVTEPSGSFDKFSAILVRHRECQVTSLVKSDAPPGKK